MLKILWKRGGIAHEEQFLLLFTIFCYRMLDFYVKTKIRFSLRDKRLFEITRVDCISVCIIFISFVYLLEGRLCSKRPHKRQRNLSLFDGMYVNDGARPRSYFFFMLNSVEHEMCPAYKC